MANFHTLTVSSASTGIKGRCVTSARTNHFVVDDVDYVGGPNEAITAGEAFFSGLTACAVLMLQRLSREKEYPLSGVSVALDATRDTEKAHEVHSIYDRVHMMFELAGVDRAQAKDLVEMYQRR
jgi:uncharacterized OsmC-like protein